MVLLGNNYRTQNSRYAKAGLNVQITGVNRIEAQNLLQRAGGKVKRAIVMQHHQCDAATADDRLRQAGGSLRKAMASEEQS